MITNVPREKLLESLVKNRDEHQAIYEEAYDNYCEKVVTDIQKALEDAKNKRPVRVYSALPVPENHKDSYDNVIALLQMSVDKTIELDDQDVARYVLNKWEWERSWASNTLPYSTGR